MHIAPTQPPVSILPVNPPASPTTPAYDLIQRFGTQLEALGVSRVTYVDPTTVQLVYTNNFAGVQAAGALNDVVDGVRLLVSNQSLTADYWEATGDNVASWLDRSGIVERVERRETFPQQLAVFGSSAANEAALASLVRSQLDDGTSIDVKRRMWAL
jgi:hypothetical protein